MKLVFLLILLFLLPQKVYAASISFQNGKSTLNNDEEYAIDATITIQASENTPYYLRGVFSKQGSSNYCGYTWNGSSWYSGPYSTNEGWKNFLPIIIKNNTWSGQIKAKLDTEDSGCHESGNYTFKIERFTPSGSGTFDTQSEQVIAITVPSPTVTPTPSPKASPTSKPTPTNKPTSTPLPMKNTPTSLPLPSILPSQNSYAPSPSISISTISAMILGASISATPTVVLVKTDVQNKTDIPMASIIMVLVGVILILACGILGFKAWKKKGFKDEV